MCCHARTTFPQHVLDRVEIACRCGFLNPLEELAVLGFVEIDHPASMAVARREYVKARSAVMGGEVRLRSVVAH
jgi:hypothetical protein